MKKKGLLGRLDAMIDDYKRDHRGEKPLYILVSVYESAALFDEVRKAAGHDEQVVLTEYRGCKIVEHGSMRKGDLHLSNELPELSG